MIIQLEFETIKIKTYNEKRKDFFEKWNNSFYNKELYDKEWDYLQGYLQYCIDNNVDLGE